MAGLIRQLRSQVPEHDGGWNYLLGLVLVLVGLEGTNHILTPVRLKRPKKLIQLLAIVHHRECSFGVVEARELFTRHSLQVQPEDRLPGLPGTIRAGRSAAA